VCQRMAGRISMNGHSRRPHRCTTGTPCNVAAGHRRGNRMTPCRAHRQAKTGYAVS
jgi:hypothetical protein